MKVAISNLAWEFNEDGEILPLLEKYKIKGIEIAPTKIWQDPINTNEHLLKAYKKYWEEKGISIVATTSLLFGHPELTIFDDNKTRDKTLEYLSQIIRLSAYLGAKATVFGSPKNRQTNGLPQKEVLKIAQEFFFAIGEVAKRYGIFFGIEPNPKFYGTDFINTTPEAIKLVQKVNHPNFKLHLDTGAMFMNNEDYKKIIYESLPFVCHFHISEPMLRPINQASKRHQTIAKILKSLYFDKWVSLEMSLKPKTNHKEIIDRVLKIVTNIYN